MGALLGVAAFFSFPHFNVVLLRVGFGALLLAIVLFLVSLYYLFFQYYWYGGGYVYYGGGGGYYSGCGGYHSGGGSKPHPRGPRI